VETGEACDDGNSVSGDGCSSTCQTEAGFTCITTPPDPSVCSLIQGGVCGDGTVGQGEQCDSTPLCGADCKCIMHAHSMINGICQCDSPQWLESGIGPASTCVMAP